jgi:hypothetical protein
MLLTCAKCARANPPGAQYCYHDGVALSGALSAGPVSIGLKAFTAPFVLPNGKQCRNFDQLAGACQENWAGAVEALQRGQLEQFLAGQGRADLASAARAAAGYPDKDRGLDQFLAKLPSQAVPPPKLLVEPLDLHLGQLRIGASKSVALKMRNHGMRLIYGSVTVQNAPWLTVGSGAGAQQKLFQFGGDLTLAVTIQGKRLRASNKPLEGKLVIDSNAGTFSISVKAEVPVKPFPSGVLAGARSPRQVAEKAKANPKEAAPLFENGAVAQWYRDNGWTYPVKGASASGLGAVQQFFEALGLTPPPKVEVSEKQVCLQGQAGGQLRHTLEIRANEKRPVYAQASADQPWLEVGRARLSGRVATIPLTVSNVPARDGETLTANVTVTANGNQRFVIPVKLTVGGAFSTLTPLAAGGAAPVIMATRPGRPGRRGVNFLVAALLLLCLFGVATLDLVGSTSPLRGMDPGSEPGGGTIGKDGCGSPEPYDYEPRIAISFTEDTQRPPGIAVLRLRDPLYPDKPKLLTRYERGNTNNACVRIDGHDYVFGREQPAVGIKWKVLNGKVQREVKSDQGRKYVSTMRYERERIEVSQIVELVVGEQTRLFDTALITYRVKNLDDRPHTVGIRAMIDTYIGLNDGTPIFIPPTDDHAQVRQVDTMIVLEKAQIPPFVRVLENDNLKDPNTTVAEMGLKLRRCEDITRMVICRWPLEWGASEARWDWPFTPMNEPAGKEKDSCVVLYWNKLTMAHNEERVMGFTYGLGRVGSANTGPQFIDKSQGRIRLDVASARKGRPFWAVASIKGADGQKCTLKLPAGVSFVNGENPSKPVQTEQGKGYAVVAWRVVAQDAGQYAMEAVLDDGAKDQATAEVLSESIFSGH